MVDAVKRVVAAHAPGEEDAAELTEETDAMVDVLVPTVFNFPTIGKIVVLGFIPFAAWFDGAAFSPVEFTLFVGSGLFSAFAGANVSLPYLLDIFALPADLYQLFLVSAVLTGRIGVSVGAMHIIVLCLMSLALIYGGIRFTLKRIAIYTTLVVSVTFVVITGAGFVIDRAISHEYTQDRALTSMHILREPVTTLVHGGLPTPLTPIELAGSRVDVIEQRGSIRVGYLPDRLPFAFRNVDGNVVGFDIAMAHELARDFEWALEIVRVEGRGEALNAVNAGQIDILMTGLSVTPQASARFTLTSPHLEQNFAFMTEDRRRGEFSNLSTVQRTENLRIAIPDRPYFVRQAQALLPKAELVKVQSPRTYLRGQVEADALAYTAEAGSAWSLIYPDYTVAIPRPTRVKLPMTFALPKGDVEFLSLMEDWLELKRRDDTIAGLFDYWILGKSDAIREPRWSVIRNVLHWVD